MGAAAASVLVAGCGAGGDAGEPGRLVVRESLPGVPIYVEGSVGFVKIERGDEVVFDSHFPRSGARGGHVLERQLEAGEYRVASYQRPCNGSCDLLDEPTDGCETVISVDAGETVTATVVVSADGSCTVRHA